MKRSLKGSENRSCRVQTLAATTCNAIRILITTTFPSADPVRGRSFEARHDSKFGRHSSLILVISLRKALLIYCGLRDKHLVVHNLLLTQPELSFQHGFPNKPIYSEKGTWHNVYQWTVNFEQTGREIDQSYTETPRAALEMPEQAGRESVAAGCKGGRGHQEGKAWRCLQSAHKLHPRYQDR